MSYWHVRFYYKDPASEQIYDHDEIVSDWCFWDAMKDYVISEGKDSILDHTVSVEFKLIEEDKKQLREGIREIPQEEEDKTQV
jgi:hypothetical protein